MNRLVFTVTNDLNYDQRMSRICSSLANAGYAVTLVGRKQNKSIALEHRPYKQERLKCLFEKGKLFYLEYNTRLFFYLLFTRFDLICAIDLDTILPCYFSSAIRGKKRVYDAHELFCEMKEIVTRPRIYRIWKRLERFAVPRFKFAYTVNQLLATEFENMYGGHFDVIRNLPVLKPLVIPDKPEKYVFYQGAVNHGRSFETVIPAFKNVNARLLIAGNGNFMEEAVQLVKENGLDNKITFLGQLPPERLYDYTVQAWIGLTLFENKGLSNFYSLANRFFDYIGAGVPQVCVKYPAYIDLNKSYNIAVLVEDLSPSNVANTLNRLLDDESFYRELQNNCMTAREQLNWQSEEKKLLAFYKTVFNS